MTALHASFWLPLLAAIVAVVLVVLWRISNASRSVALEIMSDTAESAPSQRVHALVYEAVETARRVAISRGQDVLPFSIVENGDPPTRALANHLDARARGTVGAIAYREAVELAFKALASQESDRALLAYSGRVQHDGGRTDAVILEAFEYGDLVTFRFAQPYRLDEANRTGTIEGSLYRLPDGPPRFRQSPAPAY